MPARLASLATRRVAVQGLRPRGFTLIELLVSVALGMVIMALATSAFLHCQRIIKRAEALVRLHRQAGDIAGLWDNDMASLMQQTACNGTTTYSGGKKTLVQFTGMRSLREFWDVSIYDLPRDTDMAWVRWEWRAADRSLSRAKSPPPHGYVWYVNHWLPLIDGGELPYAPVIGMRPSAVRTYQEFLDSEMSFYDPLNYTGDPLAGTYVAAAGTPRKLRIYDRLFLTGEQVESGVTVHTYTGMPAEQEINPTSGQRPNPYIVPTWQLCVDATTWATRLPIPDQRRVLADGVEDCSISIITRNGTVISDSGSGFNNSSVAASYNGTDTASNDARPQRLRLSLTLVDRATGLRQSFVFSAKAP